MQALGCGPAEHEGHVRGLVAAKKDSIKTQKSLMEELAGLHGQALAHEAQQQGSLHSTLQCADYSRLDCVMVCCAMLCYAMLVLCYAMHTALCLARNAMLSEQIYAVFNTVQNC